MDPELIQYAASVFKTIGHPVRLKIIELLQEGPCSVCRIAQQLQLPQALVSQHLATLKNKRILTCHREGATVYYQIANPTIIRLIDCIQQCKDKNKPQEIS